VNYVKECRIHPPSDLIAGLYTKRLARGRVGGGIPILYLLTGSKHNFKMASDLMESYTQQFSHNTAEIVSTTTKIPTLYGGKTMTAANFVFFVVI